jgi:hypothetical protein
MLPVRQFYDGRIEALVVTTFPLPEAGKTLYQRPGIALDDDIKVKMRLSQEQVTDRSSDQIDGDSCSLCCRNGRADPGFTPQLSEERG